MTCLICHIDRTAIGCRVNRKPNGKKFKVAALQYFTPSRLDCKFHYESCFIRNPIYDGLPGMTAFNITMQYPACVCAHTRSSTQKFTLPAEASALKA